MSCYLRYLRGILAEIGVTPDTSNRKTIDRVIHELLEVEYKNCPGVGRELKARLADPKTAGKIKNELKTRLAGAGLR